MDTRVCRKCLVEKPFEEFSSVQAWHCNACKEQKRRANIEYLRRYHREHAQEQSAKKAVYRAEHAEEIAARKAKHYWEHREEIAVKMKKDRADHPEREHARAAKRYAEHAEEEKAKKVQYYLEHGEEVKARVSQYRKDHPEKIKADMARWYAEHPEQAKANRIRWKAEHPAEARANNMRYEARKRGLPATFDIEARAFMLSYWGYACAVCGRQEGLFGWTLADDHTIPLSAPDCPGTVATNMLPLCHGKGGCNNSKSTKNLQVWLISRFGKRKAAVITRKITDYFAKVSQHTANEPS